MEELALDTKTESSAGTDPHHLHHSVRHRLGAVGAYSSTLAVSECPGCSRHKLA